MQACDEFGNARKMGGDRFKAAIRGLDGDAVAVTDRGDGSYGVQYTAPSEGTFSLAVTGADACHVSGSPATLTVFRRASYHPTNFAAIVPPVEVSLRKVLEQTWQCS